MGLIKAFLGSTSQRMVIDGEESDSIPVTSGVPKGSVLGPILFLIYLNDLPDEVCSQVRIFANDTDFYLTMEREDDSCILQNDLDKIETFTNKWDVKFNLSKCQVVQVPSSRTPLRTTYTLQGQVLKTK